MVDISWRIDIKLWKSWTQAGVLIVADGDWSGVAEVVIRDLARMKVMDSCVDVEVGLKVVADLWGILELFSSAAHAVCQGSVAGWHPTTLDSRLFLLVSLLLLVFAEESSDRLDCLLGVNLFEAASWLSSLRKLGNSPWLECVALAGNPTLVLRSVIGVLLSGRMLR